MKSQRFIPKSIRDRVKNRYGLVRVTMKPIVFYFEVFTKKENL